MSEERRYIYITSEGKKKYDFFEFLNTLEYVRNAELDNEKPIDERRILFKKRWQLISQGFAFAGTFTGILVLFHILMSAIAVIAYYSGENPYPAYFGVFFIDLAFIGVKVGIPVWIISEYYLWNRGITHLFIRNFIYGYTAGAFMHAWVKFLLFLIAFGFIHLFSETKIVKKLEGAVIFHGYYLIFLFFQIPLAFAPLAVLKIYDKKRAFKKKPWHLLDEIPD